MRALGATDGFDYFCLRASLRKSRCNPLLWRKALHYARVSICTEARPDKQKTSMLCSNSQSSEAEE